MKKLIALSVISIIALTGFFLTRFPVTASDYPPGEKAYLSYTIGNNPTVTIKKNFFTGTMYLCEEGGKCMAWVDKDGNVKKAQ